MIKKVGGQNLLDENEIEGISIRPWSFKQVTDLLPWAQKILLLVREAKISVEVLKRFMDKPRENIEDVVGILEYALPLMPELVEKTCGIPAQEVEEWNFDKTLKVVLLILHMNADRLKSLFAFGIVMIQKSEYGSLSKFWARVEEGTA